MVMIVVVVIFLVVVVVVVVVVIVVAVVFNVMNSLHERASQMICLVTGVFDVEVRRRVGETISGFNKNFFSWISAFFASLLSTHSFRSAI